MEFFRIPEIVIYVHLTFTRNLFIHYFDLAIIDGEKN